MQSERKYYMDILKVVGMLLLILAHVHPPEVILEIRNFDVPLMVFVSGILAVDSRKRVMSYWAYVKKRAKRLIIPTWLFLSILYIAMYLVHQLPSIDIIIKSFFLQRDSGVAGYVWIIWVFLVCALLNPILQQICVHKKFFLYIIGGTIIYELIVQFTDFSTYRILYYTIFTGIPYGLFMAVGMAYGIGNIKHKKNIILGVLLIHIVYAIVLIWMNGRYISVAEFKYPARFYYFSYALPIIIVLFEIVKKYETLLPRSKMIIFISKHSLWIYLWHIFGLLVFKYILNINAWEWVYLGVLLSSIIITYIQVFIVNKIYKQKKVEVLKYFLD